MTEVTVLGYRLRDARERAGYSQRQLSELLGFSENQIYRYENGQTDPSSRVVLVLSTALGVSADWLLGITDDSKNTQDVSPRETRIISALRKGDKLQAIRLIVEEA